MSEHRGDEVAPSFTILHPADLIQGIGIPTLDPETGIPNDAWRLARLIDITHKAPPNFPLALWALDKATLHPQRTPDMILEHMMDNDHPRLWPAASIDDMHVQALQVAINLHASNMAWRVTTNRRLLAIAPSTVHGLTDIAHDAVTSDAVYQGRLTAHQFAPNDTFLFRIAQNALFARLAFVANNPINNAVQ